MHCRAVLLPPMRLLPCRSAVLLKRFVDSRDEVPDPYQHMALVLTNLSRQQSGRQMLLEPGRGTFSALASQLSAPSALRQSGCANGIRNCCFCAEVGRYLPAGLLCLRMWCAGGTCICKQQPVQSFPLALLRSYSAMQDAVRCLACEALSQCCLLRTDEMW